MPLNQWVLVQRQKCIDSGISETWYALTSKSKWSYEVLLNKAGLEMRSVYKFSSLTISYKQQNEMDSQLNITEHSLYVQPCGYVLGLC